MIGNTIRYPKLKLIHGGCDRRFPRNLDEIRGVHWKSDNVFLWVDFPERDDTAVWIFDIFSSHNAPLRQLIKQWQKTRLTHLESLSPLPNKGHKLLQGFKGVCKSPGLFVPISPITLIIHAVDNGYKHLGDCWLVRFERTGNTAYIPSDFLWRDQLTE